MTDNLSNPFSTGGGGVNFETRIQASFAVLLLAGGYCPCLSPWKISKIKTQAKANGFATDDVVVFVTAPDGKTEERLMGQIKHALSITKSSVVFQETVAACWRDYNLSHFTKTRDVVAIITGPLSGTDLECRDFLDWARSWEDETEFFNRVKLAKFCSDAKREKLDAIIHALELTNGTRPSDKDIFHFLRHLRLLTYDLDIKQGIVLSLVQSLISANGCNNSGLVWSKVLDEVQSANQTAGTICHANFSHEVLDLFKPKQAVSIAPSLIQSMLPSKRQDYSGDPEAKTLSLLMLAGSWDENTKYQDRTVVERLLSSDYASLSAKFISIKERADSRFPIKKDGSIWSVNRNDESIAAVGAWITDDDLQRFSAVAVDVLSATDSSVGQADLIQATSGQTLKYSQQLRTAVAETLAILANRTANFSSCSAGKCAATCICSIRDILSGNDPKLWASLNSLIPLLAEASPDEFIRSIERISSAESATIEATFKLERGGVFGRTYTSGILWACESLAWDPVYFPRVVQALSAMARIDPGGNWGNRPINSLVSLFLPWYPQTKATVTQRRSALAEITRDNTATAWTLLQKILPGSTQSASENARPKWRPLVETDPRTSVDVAEFRSATTDIINFSISIAAGDIDKLSELISGIDKLGLDGLSRVLDIVRQINWTSLATEKKVSVWRSLIDVSAHHRRYASAEWAMPSDILAQIDSTASTIEPASMSDRYTRLFIESDFDLLGEKEEWKDGIERVISERITAINDLLRDGGGSSVIEFARKTESPYKVGSILAKINPADFDAISVIRMLLSGDDGMNKFASGYVFNRTAIFGTDWLGFVPSHGFDLRLMVRILCRLPFDPSIWTLAERWLGDNVAAYWAEVMINPHGVEEEHLANLVTLADRHGRPDGVIDCLSLALRKGRAIDARTAERALIACVEKQSSLKQFDLHDAIEVIKHLQTDPNRDEECLITIEFKFADALNRHTGSGPITVERKMANDAEFFYSLLALLYKSEKEVPAEIAAAPEGAVADGESMKVLATTTWKIFREWSIVPGTASDGTFSGSDFISWFNSVKLLCEENGRLENALYQIGEVLHKSPPDPSGFWMHKDVAVILNDINNERMRRGYSIRWYNSRGGHFVDPTGAEDDALASNFESKAQAANEHGFSRIATVMSDLAASYRQEAENHRKDHRRE